MGQVAWVKCFSRHRKLPVLSFMFISNFRRCPFGQKLTGVVLYLSKSCTFCPLCQTQLDFSIYYKLVLKHKLIYIIVTE
ncbi:hypothetical protein Hanom_Chr08g00755511 [Helianthus anomalus]